MNEPVLEYQQPERTSPAAVVVLCLAFFGALLFVFVVPPLVMMFAAALVRNGLSLQRQPRGYRLATAAVRVSGVAALAGVGAFILLSMPVHHSRELANRSTCAANLRGITMSMNAYAADGGSYPIVGPTYTSTLASALPGPTGPADTLLSNKSGGLYTGTMPGNVCHNMWLLVIAGKVAPKQFLCKSDPAGGSAAPSTVAGSTDYYANFTAGPRSTPADTDQTHSYSFAFMWTASGKIGDWWKSDTDAGLPLIADIAPASGTGTAGTLANTLDGTRKTRQLPQPPARRPKHRLRRRPRRIRPPRQRRPIRRQHLLRQRPRRPQPPGHHPLLRERPSPLRRHQGQLGHHSRARGRCREQCAEVIREIIRAGGNERSLAMDAYDHKRYEWNPTGLSPWVVTALLVLVVLTVLVFLPSRGHMGPSRRSSCAANLRGITQSMNVYAADGDCYPIVAFAPYAAVPNAPSGKSTGTSKIEVEALKHYPTTPAMSKPACGS